MYNCPIITNKIDSTTIHAQLETLESCKRGLSGGLSFCQESLVLDENRLANLYWVELNKSKFNFKLVSSLLLSPLLAFDLPDKKVVAGINFGSFFLSDDLQTPRVSFYNLLIKGGNIFQFPSNSRPALATNDGKLRSLSVDSWGTLKIGGKSFSWSGSKSQKRADITVYGMFDLNILKTPLGESPSRRRVLVETRFVTCKSDELLLGFNINNDKPVLEVIADSPIDLTQFCFVMRGKSESFEGLSTSQNLTYVTLGDIAFETNDDVCSASFLLGRNKDELIRNLEHQLIYTEGGRPKPLSESYLKSWSVILETDDNIIFFISDARPKALNQEGINIFELQEVLAKKFDYIWASVGDSGQSSKLMIKDDTTQIYGNMHYQNYRSDPPVWDGENGRRIPVALIAYE